MELSRIWISADYQFTADEIEVASILIVFRHCSKRLFLQWGAKRRRSGIQRDECNATHNSKLSPLDISASENEHDGMAMVVPPPSARGLLPTSRPNSKDLKAKNRPRKRPPKKKTHKELTEKVDELFLEKASLIKEVEQMRKTRQELNDCSVYLKSQLALCLEQRQDENTPYTSKSSSSHSDTRQKTETTTSCDNFQSCDGHGHFENCFGSSALGSAYDKLQRVGRPMYPCSPDSSFESEKDGAMPTNFTVFSGVLDLNTLDEALFGTNISNDFHEPMLMAKNKVVAAEASARKRKIFSVE